MKNKINIFQLIAFSLLGCMQSCETKTDGTMNPTNNAQAFATSDEAVLKGKMDLLELLKTNSGKSLNLDAESVAKAQPEETITMVDVNIDKLMNTDSNANFADVIEGDKGRITALYADNMMVTSIHTRLDKGMWSVAAIKNQHVEAEIAEIRKSNSAFSKSEITLYDIANIDAHVYQVKIDSSDLFYCNHNGMSLSTPIDKSELLNILKEDLLQFNRLNADLLKKDKLVR